MEEDSYTSSLLKLCGRLSMVYTTSDVLEMEEPNGLGEETQLTARSDKDDNTTGARLL